jgi:hypothetical protein
MRVITTKRTSADLPPNPHGLDILDIDWMRAMVSVGENKAHDMSEKVPIDTPFYGALPFQNYFCELV